MITSDSKLEWWGYLHVDGHFQVKRAFYSIQDDMKEASESPFVKTIYGPFEASNREEALEIIKNNLEVK